MEVLDEYFAGFFYSNGQCAAYAVVLVLHKTKNDRIMQKLNAFTIQ